jgi:methylmalonyl-CoA/ethylmalonyl-CoA epimerase
MAHRVIGLAKINLRVRDLDGTVERFGDLLGAEPMRDRGSDTIGAFNAATMSLGGAVLDVVSPNDPEGELAKNLERRGEGIDSIAYFVEDLDDTAAYLSKRGVELVNRHDYHGSKVAFIHPKVNSGVMVELIQQASDRGE